MTKIGLLSDTHGFLHEKLFDFYKDCDEIWHAGDIGNIQTANKFVAFKPLRAVFGNMDGRDVRIVYPEHQRFFCEQVDVWITHIGGYPGNYAKEVKPLIFKKPPRLFITGHSHILKVIPDKKLDLLHINPGSAGRSGFHKVLTAVRFLIEGKEIKDLEVIELEPK